MAIHFMETVNTSNRYRVEELAVPNLWKIIFRQKFFLFLQVAQHEWFKS